MWHRSPSERVPHCCAPHDSSPFTAEGFIVPQLSLVVWQKNWKSTDYVYFQNRAYQSVIRLLWCSLLYLCLMIRVISVLSPRMCCFPSRQGYLEYCVCVCECVWSIFQIIWMTLSKNDTISGHEDAVSCNGEKSLCAFLHFQQQFFKKSADRRSGLWCLSEMIKSCIFFL